MTTLTVLLIVLGGWVFSLCLHEWSHAAVAYLGGDTTVRDKGYLTFNPLRYTDPMLSIGWPLLFLALGGIGLPGGAVWIETHRLRGPMWKMAVSLAGPVANLVVAVILAIAWHLAGDASPVWQSVAFLVQLQLMAVLFNLLPVPPLDGYRALEPWLGDEWRQRLLPVARWGFLVILVLLWFVPPAARMFWSILDLGMQVLGVSTADASIGYHLLRDIVR